MLWKSPSDFILFLRNKKNFKIHQTKRSFHWKNMTKSGQITVTFTTKSDQEIGLSDKILSAVYLTCIRPDFETPDTRHADIKQSRNFHVVKKINRLIRSLRTFCHSVSSVLLLLCKAMQKSSKVHIFWEGPKILRNPHLTFVLCSASQK